MTGSLRVWIATLLTAAGTYVFRIAGSLPAASHLRARGWLHHVPSAVLLVLAVDAVIPQHLPSPGLTLALGAATVAVVGASLLRVPLLLRLAVGCVVYALLQP
jgi:uncharacterized membrane protein